jgi:hypothetical protein
MKQKMDEIKKELNLESTGNYHKLELCHHSFLTHLFSLPVPAVSVSDPNDFMQIRNLSFE